MSILERQAARRGHAEQAVAMTGGRGHTLDIDSVTHRYGPIAAVAEVSLAVRAGEIVALLGPSGCGKTTLLRVVAGFVRQSAGSVRIDGKPIDHLAANMRNVGIVFQNYALFPHMTVAQNVAYGLQARGRPREEVRRTVDRFLEVVRLTEFRDRLPRQLSGGQQQRVAVARALVGGAYRALARRAIQRPRQEPASGHANRDQAAAAPVRAHRDPGHARSG